MPNDCKALQNSRPAGKLTPAWHGFALPLLPPANQPYIGAMKQILLPAALIALISAPLAAQETGEEDSGPSLMERGAELFWEGLREEMAPALDDLQGMMAQIGPSMAEFLSEMGPALAEIAKEVEDWSAYELPEILPNGDIIIRKKPKDNAPADKDKGEEEGVTEI